MHVKTVFTCAVCTIDSACFGHIFSLIHCKLGLPSMQRVQRLIYFSCINRNMITIFEYFIIDCHNHSISLLAGTIPVLIMCNLLSLKPFWCILSGQSIKMDLLYDYKHYSAHAFPSSPAVSGAKQVSRSIFFPPKCRGKYNLNIEYFSTPWWK